jgi:hypothetical protein
MRRFLTAAVLSAAALLALPSMAQEAPRSEIEGVIQNQIDAFVRDDFDTAFTYASPNIKQLFGTPDRFGMMVRQGYPMVWRPADVRYLDLETIDGRLWQKVMITDAAGAVHVLGYQMIETAEGWQINGVQVLQAPQVGA